MIWMIVLCLGPSAACFGGGSAPAVDLVIVGDSNSYGESAWPYILEKSLSRELDSTSAPIRLINQSQPGRALAVDRGGIGSTALHEIEDWLASARSEGDGRIEVVLLALGTNDVQDGLVAEPFPTREYASDADGVFRRLRSAAPESEIIVLTPPPLCSESVLPRGATSERGRVDQRWRGAHSRMTALRHLLEELARAHQMITVNGKSAVPAVDCAGLTEDGVHLDAAGHRQLAGALSDRLSTIVAESARMISE